MRSRASASSGREGHDTTRNAISTIQIKRISYFSVRGGTDYREAACGSLRSLRCRLPHATQRNATQRIAKSTWAWASHQSTPQQQWTPPSAASVPTSSARRRPPGATASPSTPPRPSTSTVRRSNYLRFPSLPFLRVPVPFRPAACCFVRREPLPTPRQRSTATWSFRFIY